MFHSFNLIDQRYLSHTCFESDSLTSHKFICWARCKVRSELLTAWQSGTGRSPLKRSLPSRMSDMQNAACAHSSYILVGGFKLTILKNTSQWEDYPIYYGK